MHAELLLDRIAVVFLSQTQAPEQLADQAQDASSAAQDAQPAGAQDLTSAVKDLDADKVGALAQQYLVPAAKAIVLLLIALVVANWARRFTIKMLIKSRVELTLAKFFGAMAKWTILLLAAIAILGILGIETASFAVVLGAMGFAVGMSLQGSLGNLASGVMLLIFRPFKVSQVVTVAGVTGKVDEIGLFSTSLDTPDNRRFVIPNGSVFGSVIENISYHEKRRVDVSVGTDYGADLDTTRDVLLKAAMSMDGILSDPEPAIVLGELGDSAISWSVRVWVNASDYWPVKDALTRAVKQHLDAANIGIPFPQMDVHVEQLAAS